MQLTRQPSRKKRRTIGLVCNVTAEQITSRKTKKWMYRALAVDQVLREKGIELFIYSYTQIDSSTDLVKGYIIKNGEFLEKEASVPLVNYNYFSGGWKNVHLRARPFEQLMDWAESCGIRFYPDRLFVRTSKDKFQSHKLIVKFNRNLSPETEKYRPDQKQVERFLDNYQTVFLKPRWGNRGFGIIVLKKDERGYQVSYYGGNSSQRFKHPDLDAAIDNINNLVGERSYVIQQGITVTRVEGAVFDVRVILVHDGTDWQWFHTVRRAVSESELSNLSQGGRLYPLEEFLNKHFNKSAKSILEQLRDNSFGLAKFLDAHSPGNLLEIAFDYLLDHKQQLSLAEINVKPGMRVGSRFKDVFNRSPEDELRYQQIIFPHGRCIASYLEKELIKLEAKKESVWFDSLLGAPSPELDIKEEMSLSKLIRKAVTTRTEIPKGMVPCRDELDQIPHVVAIRVSDSLGNSGNSIGTGIGVKEAINAGLSQLPELWSAEFTVKRVELELVKNVRQISDVIISEPLSIDRHLEGIAFTRDIHLAFTRQQSVDQRFTSKRGKLKMVTIRRSLRWHPKLFRQYKKLRQADTVTMFAFSTHSIHIDVENHCELPVIGFMCGNADKMRIGERMGLSRYYRAVEMTRTLEKYGTRLFLYSPMNVDQTSGKVTGFYLDGNKFVHLEAPVPITNCCYYFGGRLQLQKQKYLQFKKWSETNGIEVYTPWDFRILMKDKYATYKLLKEFDPRVMPKTELFADTKKQLRRFLKNSKKVFIKTNTGSRGNGIITLSKSKDMYKAVFYSSRITRTFESQYFSPIFHEISQECRRGKWIVQQGISVVQYEESSIDIRAIMLHDGQRWNCMHYARVGLKGSDLSYAPDRSAERGTMEVLSAIFSKNQAEELVARLIAAATNMAEFFSTKYPGQIMEVAFDFLIDDAMNLSIAETNATPGLWYDVPYKDVFHLTPDEKTRYDAEIAPHGRSLALFLQKKLEESRN